MYIYYDDGGILECSTIVPYGHYLIADDIYQVPLSEIERIED